MKFPYFKRSLRIGLDIQAHEIRLIQLEKTHRGFRILHALKEPLTSDIFAEGKIKEWEKISALIAEWTRLFNLQGAKTVLLLSASLVRMQHLSLPKGMTEAAIEAEIISKVQHDLPGMNEALSLDYTALAHPEAGYVDILFTVTRQAYLSRYVTSIHQGGLQVSIVDIDIYALTRLILFNLNLTLQAEQLYALLHIREEKVLLILFNTQEILMHHHFSFLNQSDLLTQLHTCVQMYLNTQPLSIQQFIVCGALEYFKWMKEHASHFNASFMHCAQPFSRMHLAPTVDHHFFAEDAPHFLLACGAAMREIPAW